MVHSNFDIQKFQRDLENVFCVVFFVLGEGKISEGEDLCPWSRFFAGDDIVLWYLKKTHFNHRQSWFLCEKNRNLGLCMSLCVQTIQLKAHKRLGFFKLDKDRTKQLSAPVFICMDFFLSLWKSTHFWGGGGLWFFFSSESWQSTLFQTVQLLESSQDNSGQEAVEGYLSLARFADTQYQNIVNYMNSPTFEAKQALMNKAADECKKYSSSGGQAQTELSLERFA